MGRRRTGVYIIGALKGEVCPSIDRRTSRYFFSIYFINTRKDGLNPYILHRLIHR